MKGENNISPLLVRLGMGFVVLWFSISQISNPTRWLGLVPDYLSFVDPVNVIYFNATLEALIGVLLVLGLFTRIAALVFAIHLIPIIIQLGKSPSAVRDIGLLFANLSLFFSGSGKWTLGYFLRRKD